MRLSDVKGERTFDVIAEVIEPIANIATDKECRGLFVREKLPEGKNARDFAIEKLVKNLPKLLKNHKQDIITILAAIQGVTPKAYTKNLNLFVLTKDAMELIQDEAFGTLFLSVQSEAVKTQSGSVLENTEEAKA